MDEPNQLKIIVVGESSVGKTSLIKKFCWNHFDEQSEPTIGSDFSTKTMNRRHKQLKLQIWDTAGQEKFSSVSRLFVRKSLGCIIVSDITKGLQNHTSLEQSLIHSINWKNLVQSHSEYVDQLPIILVQNKADMIHGTSTYSRLGKDRLQF
jgi:small GTP-binding protein